jgi:hypothetical protein
MKKAKRSFQFMYIDCPQLILGVVLVIRSSNKNSYCVFRFM